MPLSDKVSKLKVCLFILLISLTLSTCSAPPVRDHKRGFNILVRYGFGGGRNELNTFQGTFTKDLILDCVTTIPLQLSNEDLSAIEERLADIRFFDYPEDFIPPPANPHALKLVEPHETYFFIVQVGSRTKVVSWEDSDWSGHPRAVALREAVKFIRSIIESKAEYKGLPPTRGIYQ
jgi:hypothetical protein